MSMQELAERSSELVAQDGNSFVRQQSEEQLNITGANIIVNTIVNYTFTPSPYMNLTEKDKLFCADVALFNTVRMWVDVGIIGPLCLAGIVGNLLAILALRLDHTNRTVTFLLQALAVADNAYLVSSLLLQTLKSATECTEWLRPFKVDYQYWEIYLWPLASIAQTTTVWLTVLVTVDRYVAICRPFESMRYQVSTRAKRAVYFIVVSAVIYNIPRFFEKEVKYVPDHCNRVFRHVALHTPLRKHHLYKLIYKTIFFLLFRMVGPLGVLIVLNIKLIQTLRRARKDHAQLTQTANQRTNNYFNLILVAVVSVFLVCQTPDFIMRVLVAVRTYAKLKFQVYWPNIFTNMMLTVNSSVNCLIYCLTGRKFRQILCRIVCRRSCCRRKPPIDESLYRKGVISGDMSFSATNTKRATSLSAVNETCL